MFALTFSLQSVASAAVLLDESTPSTQADEQQTRAYFTFRNGEPHSRTLIDLEGTAISEGDIIFGPSSNFFNVEQKRQARGLSNEAYGQTWPNGLVPYQLNANLSASAKEKIMIAVDHWNSVGSITMVERNSANASAYPDYIDFINENRCASWIGYRQSGPQSIYTGDNCSAGSMIHEIGHALGLLHEHTRPDRDNFVKIHWDRIAAKMELNFEVIPGSDVVGPYDFGSIMHYGPTFFSSDGRPTIEPLQATTATMGQRITTSKGDKESINSLYQSDLALVTSGETTAPAGNATDVTFYITNNSTVGANTLRVQLPVPAGSALLSYNSTHWTCAQYLDTETITCESPVLTAGAASQVSMQLSTPQTAGSMLLDATLSSRTPDTNANDNQDSATITVLTSSDDVPVIAAAQASSENRTPLTVLSKSSSGGSAGGGGGGAFSLLMILLPILLLPLSRRRSRPVLISKQ